MGGFVRDAVEFSDEFEAVGRLPLGGSWPVNLLGAEGAGHSDDVEHIPTRTAVFPLPFIGVVEVTPEEMLDKLIVETDGVKTEDNCFGGKNFFGEDFCELAFFNSLLLGELGGDFCG